nr:helix-turn-helix transcriptional regulator [uncultured Sphaerochaeta sp.]
MNHETILLYRNAFERERMLSRLAGYPQLRLHAHRLGTHSPEMEMRNCICYCSDLPSVVQMKRMLPSKNLLIFCPKSMKMMCSLLEDQYTIVLSLTCSESLLEMMLGRFLSAPHPHDGVNEQPAVLTRREHQVLTLMVSGQETRQIASLLGIKVSTVIAHKKHLFLKSGVHTTSQLIVWALFSLYQ